VDSAEDHERWIADINETQHAQVDFPIIADKDRRVAMLFGMLDPTTFRHGPGAGQTMTVRSVFIISPARRVELIITYPAHIGRNFDDPARVGCAAAISAASRSDAGELASGRGHRRAALHLRRGGGAYVRRPGRLEEGAVLPALRARPLPAHAARRHDIDQRLARWLLMAHDGTEADDVPMTHEFLSASGCGLSGRTMSGATTSSRTARMTGAGSAC
jgi:hypothetical protein